MKMKHWLIIAYCVCTSTSYFTHDYALDALAEKAAKATDAKFKDKELTFQQQLDALDDKIWLLKGEIDLMKMKQK